LIHDERGEQLFQLSMCQIADLPELIEMEEEALAQTPQETQKDESSLQVNTTPI
ncbi:unnamed protein product, partial [Rhizoctonia solani]